MVEPTPLKHIVSIWIISPSRVKINIFETSTYKKNYENKAQVGIPNWKGGFRLPLAGRLGKNCRLEQRSHSILLGKSVGMATFMIQLRMFFPRNFREEIQSIHVGPMKWGFHRMACSVNDSECRQIIIMVYTNVSHIPSLVFAGSMPLYHHVCDWHPGWEVDQIYIYIYT